MHRCRRCGSTDTEAVAEIGKLQFSYEVDVRHMPTELSDAEVEALHADARRGFDEAMERKKADWRAARDARRKDVKHGG